MTLNGKHPMSRSNRLHALLAFLVALGFSACAGSDAQMVPFPMGPAGASASASFSVRETQSYAVSLVYVYKEGDPGDRAQVWKRAGGSVQESTGQWVESGAPLRLQIRVFRKQAEAELPIAEKTVNKPRLSSWGAATLSAELWAATLGPGSYRVTVVSLDEAPPFLGAQTSLQVARAYRGK